MTSLPSRLYRFLRDTRHRLAGPLDELGIVESALRRLGSGMVMIDVGAHHGNALRAFAEHGARVFAFEPDSSNRVVLRDRYSSLSNVIIDERAVGMEEQSDVPFFTSPTSTGISGLSVFEAHHAQTGTVDVTTLANFLDEHPVDSIDLLKIDTEGFDFHVLRGFPWERLRPRFIVCEFEDRKTIPLGYRYDDMAGYLAEHGYHVLVSEWHPIVRYGVSHRWNRFAEYPASLATPDAWGNLIACLDGMDFKRVQRAARAAATRYRLSQSLRGMLGRS